MVWKPQQVVGKGKIGDRGDGDEDYLTYIVTAPATANVTPFDPSGVSLDAPVQPGTSTLMIVPSNFHFRRAVPQAGITHGKWLICPSIID